METYSQIGQDRWVCEFFNYAKDRYFLDLGAYDGIQFSNTYYLEKVLGWDGICVEPDKDAFKPLVKNRNCLCIDKAISDVNKTVEFSKPGAHGYIKKGGELLVEAITIEKLMIDNKVPFVIDYISMDIEWQEIRVLPTFPFDRYEAILWTIEHNLYSEGPKVKEAIKEIMISNGYIIGRENVGGEDGNAIEDWWINKKYIDGLDTRR